MTLTLEVIGPQAAKLGPAHRKVLAVDGRAWIAKEAGRRTGQ